MSRAHPLLAYFGARFLGANDTQIARAAGVSQQCIYRARVRGSELAQGLGVTWGSSFGVVESEALDKKVD